MLIGATKELEKKDEAHKEGGKKSRKAVIYGETVGPCKKTRYCLRKDKCYEDRYKYFQNT
jgi:hypothetical protein